jgi:hypothetical protein
MSSTSDIIKNFNSILESLLVQLSPVIGTTLSYNYQLVIKYNAIVPIDQFLIYALPIRDKIINRDETYFLTQNQEIRVDGQIKESIDLSEKVFNKINNSDEESIDKYKNAINEILRLKDIYEHLDNESKNNIWDIFNALLVLGEDYVKIKYGNSM